MKNNHFKLLSLKNYALLFTMIMLGFVSCKDDDDNIPVSCDGIHWEYEGEDGPDHWGELCVGYEDCSGSSQSPINITGAVNDATLTSISKSYTTTATHIVNNGHTIQFNEDAGSSIVVNGVTYNLLQFHFHTQSEHTVGGKQYPMEVHFVHKNDATGNLAVIGVFFEEGAENPFLAQFIDHLPASKDATYEAAATYNPADVFPTDSDYFTYPGSLTTPPCSEIVTWIVMEHPVEASLEQIHHFEDLEHENFRPVQALQGRVIKHFAN